MKNILSIDIDWVQDWTQYKQITRTVAPWIKEKKFKNVTFGITHDKISSVIDSYDEPVNIVNVDHHHDWEYADLNCSIESGYKFCNWLGWYVREGKIKKATWIANPHSGMETGRSNSSIEGFIDIHFDLDVINQYEYEELFICHSPAWIESNWAAHAAYETFQLITKLSYET